MSNTNTDAADLPTGVLAANDTTPAMLPACQPQWTPGQRYCADRAAQLTREAIQLRGTDWNRAMALLERAEHLTEACGIARWDLATPQQHERMLVWAA